MYIYFCKLLLQNWSFAHEKGTIEIIGHHRNDRAVLYAANIPVLTFMLTDRNRCHLVWERT